MANSDWSFLNNTFYTNTRKSMKNALSLTRDHLAKLTANQTEADVAAMLADFLPYHTAFLVAYNQLNSKLGLYVGKTQSTEEIMDELTNEKLNEWRGKVFNVFPEGTADALSIFPRGRRPFNKGTYEQRIEAVETLAKTLGTFSGEPALLNLSTAVEAYYNTLSGARALQQGDEGSVGTLRFNLKENHKLLCEALFKNLGLLMAKYCKTPQRVKGYFDLTLLIRKKGKTEDEEGGAGAENELYKL